MTIYHEGGERRRCLDVHTHHVGQSVVDRIEAEGERHGVRLVTSDDGAKRIDVGGRATGMPLIPPLTDERARLKWMDGITTLSIAPCNGSSLLTG